jgi:hypothetical protein
MNEKILAHLSATPEWQTAKQIADVVTPGERSRPVAEALHSLVASGAVEQRGGQMLGEPKEYRAKG